MKKTLKIMVILAIIHLVSALSVFTGCPKEESSGLIKVGIVNLPPEESGYRQANVEDMNNVFSKANGYDAKQTNTGDNSEQIAVAKGYIRDGVDYLLISAANASGWDNTLKSAKAAGIKVILFDRAIDTDESNFQAALLSDMAYEGDTAVDWVLNSVPKPINLVLIRGQMGCAAEIGRPLLGQEHLGAFRQQHVAARDDLLGALPVALERDEDRDLVQVLAQRADNAVATGEHLADLVAVLAGGLNHAAGRGVDDGGDGVGGGVLADARAVCSAAGPGRRVRDAVRQLGRHPQVHHGPGESL